MDVRLVTRNGRVYRDGNEMLRYKILLPSIDGCESINAFFERIADRCEEFCKQRLACELERKGYYELCSAVTHADEDAFAMILRARLFCRGEICKSFSRSLCFNVKSQRMMPPRTLVKKYGKGQKIKGSEGVFIAGGEVRRMSDVEIDTFFRKKR